VTGENLVPEQTGQVSADRRGANWSSEAAGCRCRCRSVRQRVRRNIELDDDTEIQSTTIA